MALVSSIFNFFIDKIALANKWMRKIIPSCSNSALSQSKNSVTQEPPVIQNTLMFILVGTYLNTCFGEVYLHGNLFTRVDVWIMCLLERPLQFFELCGCESSSDPPLFPFFCENSIVVVAGINFVQ